MKILVDTSIIVEIDRGNKEVTNLLKRILENHELIISTITVGEILTGSHLNKNQNEAIIKAKEILNQFTWHNINGVTAEITAKLYSYLIIENKHKSVEYQDVLIAASFLASNSDYLLTLNIKDFKVFPNITNSVVTLKELNNKI